VLPLRFVSPLLEQSGCGGFVSNLSASVKLDSVFRFPEHARTANGQPWAGQGSMAFKFLNCGAGYSHKFAESKTAQLATGDQFANVTAGAGPPCYKRLDGEGAAHAAILKPRAVTGGIHVRTRAPSDV
jgi:hypothetical protein